MNESKDSTQRQILELLRKSDGGLTTDALCKALQVTTMAVHRQLAILNSQGLVTAQLVRLPRGRPTHVYRLTDAADQFFPKTYAKMLLELLEDLNVTDGFIKLREIFERRSRRFVENHREKLAGKDFPAKVKTVCNILDQYGYEPEVQPVSEMEIHLKLFNCPIAQVAKNFPDTCSCEQSYLTELLEAKVTRDHHLLAEQNYCSYIIQHTAK
ncbi:MAG: HTH domain-containing protein [Acidobacteria bacterium]|nr:HTH domain-containing protein [Acidobacteriota bacterium]MBI3656617.1 HTH domain-containing protein [Acidobacteriota bacterium]